MVSPLSSLGTVKDSPGEPFETHIDRVIKEAVARGEFDDLPGAGKPIPGAGTKDDEGWWLRRWVKRNREESPTADDSESE